MTNNNYGCGHCEGGFLNRREMLNRTALGFGAVAATALMARSARGGITESAPGGQIPHSPHFAPRATNIIYLYMDGGPSQVDTFDPKPRLTRDHGKPFPMKMEPTQFNNNGNTLGSPWEFSQYGQSGIPVSSLFPHVARHVDDLAVIRSMVSEFSEHTNANYFLHTGLGIAGRPSMGSWISYGLGTENSNLPGYVVLNGGLIPPGGLDNFSNGFLPATYQGSVFKPQDPPVANILPLEEKDILQRNKLKLMRRLDRGLLSRFSNAGAIESAVANHELAFRMQSAVPELVDISGESMVTRKMYGMDASFPQTRTFAYQCLLARRLVERGVRFIELTCPSVGADRWDQHSNLKDGHEKNCLAVDQPIGALLTDLKARGLLDSTLVVWSGEFGRTPFAQGSNGRDHNPFGFSLWMAGGGVRGGTVYGATDEYGYKVVENRVEVYDLHATMLHLLGINHEELTFRFSGRDMRLTDVHGHVIREVIA
jgi:hypothetical protein